MSDNQHWNKAYEARPTEELGWYEEHAGPSFELLEKTGLPKNARILNVGAGSSTMVDELINAGYTDIIVNDFSSAALVHLKNRLGDGARRVTFIEDDLTNPSLLSDIEPVDLWHDRAVLHFFKKESEKETYFDLLKKIVKPGGFVILAEFSLTGAEKCCGLELCRWNEEMLSERLGEDFQLIESFDYTFINPRGEDRPYIYTLYRRHG